MATDKTLKIKTKCPHCQKMANLIWWHWEFYKRAPCPFCKKSIPYDEDRIYFDTVDPDDTDNADR